MATKDGKVYRIEVKYISVQATTPRKLCITIGRNLGKFDVLALVQPDWNVKYIEHDTAKRMLENGAGYDGLAAYLIGQAGKEENHVKVATTVPLE